MARDIVLNCPCGEPPNNVSSRHKNQKLRVISILGGAFNLGNKFPSSNYGVDVCAPIVIPFHRKRGLVLGDNGIKCC